MTKITVDHLARSAFVYIRQSTADQLVHNQESRRRQYGLADRARQLGWVTVEVVDDDLGRSGGGITRPGFERLLAAICEGRVWDEFERNQRLIADNATGKGSAAARGAARHGELLLSGLLRCGHCGRKMYVAYGGKAGRYHCEGALVNHGTERCISFGGLSADHAVGVEVLRILKPLGVEAAIKALDTQAGETSAARRQLELALAQARFEATHARRQYDAVDPANRLVAGELERRWNRALEAVHHIEDEIAAVESRKPAPLGEAERQHLMQLGADLALAWSHPAATSATRKRIVRAALSEIVVRIDGGFIEMILHWRGGDHTALKVRKNGAGKHRWTIPEDTLSLVRELARVMPDRQIARLLNRTGKPTGRGNGWTQARVCSFRSHHGIAVHRPEEWSERDEITLETAAQIMDVSIMTAHRMVRHGIIKGRQVCRGAPWAIKAADIAAHCAKRSSQRPLTADPSQHRFDFQ